MDACVRVLGERQSRRDEWPRAPDEPPSPRRGRAVVTPLAVDQIHQALAAFGLGLLFGVRLVDERHDVGRVAPSARAQRVNERRALAAERLGASQARLPWRSPPSAQTRARPKPRARALAVALGARLEDRGVSRSAAASGATGFARRPRWSPARLATAARHWRGAPAGALSPAVSTRRRSTRLAARDERSRAERLVQLAREARPRGEGLAEPTECSETVRGHDHARGHPQPRESAPRRPACLEALRRARRSHFTRRLSCGGRGFRRGERAHHIGGRRAFLSLR